MGVFGRARGRGICWPHGDSLFLTGSERADRMARRPSLSIWETRSYRNSSHQGRKSRRRSSAASRGQIMPRHHFMRESQNAVRTYVAEDVLQRVLKLDVVASRRFMNLMYRNSLPHRAQPCRRVARAGRRPGLCGLATISPADGTCLHRSCNSVPRRHRVRVPPRRPRRSLVPRFKDFRLRSRTSKEEP